MRLRIRSGPAELRRRKLRPVLCHVYAATQGNRDSYAIPQGAPRNQHLVGTTYPSVSDFETNPHQIRWVLRALFATQSESEETKAGAEQRPGAGFRNEVVADDIERGGVGRRFDPVRSEGEERIVRVRGGRRRPILNIAAGITVEGFDVVGAVID